MREAIGVSEVGWDMLTKVNLIKVAEHVKENVSSNSARTYFAEICSFLHRYDEEGIVPCKHPEDVLKAKKEPSQHVALTEDEIMKWDAYEPEDQRERDIKILFMRGCLTGARHSDCINMSEENIRDGILSYVSVKTHTEVKQPIHRLLPKYLSVSPSKDYPNSTTERVISRICMKLRINDLVSVYVGGVMRRGPKYEFITMHSSRRSYVSCLAVRDVPVSIISKLAGHSSTSMTDRYVCVDVNKLDDTAMSFFNG